MDVLPWATWRAHPVAISRLRPHGDGAVRIFCVRTVGVAVACALTLTACVFHQPYPPSWPARAEDCADLSGIYADAGERWAASVPFPFGATVVTTRSLSGLLRGTSEYGKPFHVHILRRDERTLDVRVLADHGVGTQYSVRYRCTSEGAELEMPARWLQRRLSIVRVWGTLHLTKDTSGDLIGSLQYDTYGLIFIVPIVGRGNTWYRFQHADNAPLQSPGVPPSSRSAPSPIFESMHRTTAVFSRGSP